MTSDDLFKIRQHVLDHLMDLTKEHQDAEVRLRAIELLLLIGWNLKLNQ